jgi:hypothetical protein
LASATQTIGRPVKEEDHMIFALYGIKEGRKSQVWIGLLFIFFIVVIRPADGTIQKKPAQIIATKDLSLELSQEGYITGVGFKKNKVRRDIIGGTRLAGCKPVGGTIFRKSAGDVLEYERTLSDGKGNACCLIERFSPTPTSIRWEVEIVGECGYRDRP